MPTLANVVYKLTLYNSLVYFAKIGSNPFGKPIYDQPIQIACRWEDKEQEIVMPDGRKVMAKAYVISIPPLVPGSLVFKGTLKSWGSVLTDLSTPTVNQGGKEVLTSTNVPVTDQLSSLNEAWC